MRSLGQPGRVGVEATWGGPETPEQPDDGSSEGTPPACRVAWVMLCR